METPTPQDEAAWAFLQPWFVALRRQISLYKQLQDGPEHVRVGSATKDEFYLSVRYYHEIRRNWFVSQFPCFTNQPILNLRETLVLMNLLAKANYPLWVKWMWDLLRVRLPPTVGTEKPYWRVQYSIELVGVRETAAMEYFHSLFGDMNYSDDFMRDLKLAKALLASRGIQWETIEPVSVLVRYDPDQEEDEEITFQSSIKSVRNITSIIEYSRTIHKRGLVDSACLLRITAVALDMTMTTMDGRLMDAMRACISTGVRFEYLSLPKLGDTTLLHIGDVASFWRTLLGLDPIPGGGFAEVVRLDMAAWYARSHLWAPFCSALAMSRTLRVLHLHARNAQSTDNPFGSFAVRRERAWMWLAFALFSSASSTSVETLILANRDFFRGDGDAVRTITTCVDPVALACHLSRDTTKADRPTGYTRRQVVVSEDDIVETVDARLSRSYLRVYGVKHGKLCFRGEMVR